MDLHARHNLIIMYAWNTKADITNKSGVLLKSSLSYTDATLKLKTDSISKLPCNHSDLWVVYSLIP